MKEDLLEKEIKKFMMILQQLAGLVLKNDFRETLKIIHQQYDERLIDDFILKDYFDFENRFATKTLAFQIDLLYYRLLAEHKISRLDSSLINKFLTAAQKFLTVNNTTFDISLKMKADEVKGWK